MYMYTSCSSFFALEVSASCEVIGLPLTSVDSEAEGVSSSESSSSLASLPSLSSLPASSLEATVTVVTGATGLEGGGSWRRSLECSERPLLTASSPNQEYIEHSIIIGMHAITWRMATTV